jgi:branched-chain amino acid aminotransferase
VGIGLQEAALMAERMVWLRGAVRPVHEATVSILSPTAQFGINVFEGVRTYWNASSRKLYVFRLEDHVRRLYESAKILGLDPPFEPDHVGDSVLVTLRAIGLQVDMSVRLMLFVDGEGGWRSSRPVELLIAPAPNNRRRDSDPGQAACTSTWERINDRSLPPRVKSGANYLNSRYAYLEASRNGFDVPILLGSDGHVTESSGSCVMAVRDDVLITPPVYGSILVSITRDTLLSLAAEQGLAVNERPMDRSELYTLDELFLCGTAAEVTPVVSLDHLKIGDGRPGPVTTSLLSTYLDIVDGTDPRFSEWRTAV